MRTMHAALAALAERLDTKPILTDAAGVAELVIGEVQPVYLRLADEFELELSARLPEFDGRLTPEVMAELLLWNSRFHGLRFAVEADRSGVVLGRRLDIRTLEPDRIADAAESFIRMVADWRRHGAAALLDRVMRYGGALSGSLLPGFRL